MNPRWLLVMRHGKSDRQAEVRSDFNRPLTGRGKKAVKRISRWMVQNGIKPDLIVSSPAIRARQTALRLCKDLNIDSATIFWEPDIYEADLNALLRVLSQCEPKDQTVILIGHNPTLEDLVRYLAGPELTDEGTGLLPAGGVAKFEMPQDWKRLYPGSGRNCSIIRPQQLRDE